MFKQISNLMSMVGQAREMSSKMGEVSEQLKTERVSGLAGGGMVEVAANGLGEIVDVKIDDTVMADKEMLLDLLPAAINQATAKSKEIQMKSFSGGMDMPGLSEAMEQLSGGAKS